MKFSLGFFNDSSSKQDWAVFLDSVSIATFQLEAHKGSGKWVPVEMGDGGKVQITVSATGDAAADLTVVGTKLVLSSHTPRVWRLDQETGTQYTVYCSLTQVLPRDPVGGRRVHRVAARPLSPVRAGGVRCRRVRRPRQARRGGQALPMTDEPPIFQIPSSATMVNRVRSVLVAPFVRV
ncbi:hypothetical protein L6E12_24085 [Actinokineospora sp. PR83]|uniref:hypothetical protein n=1 Tax=Actinokineospora sp. PR83 TaxID=2884908 RepID=UPI001F320EFB|nr:hypothetical protein [Actinokineospora sp. PR83]MCG8918863.1 hypothetical protein [Actinokineospora sp. PR83]